MTTIPSLDYPSMDFSSLEDKMDLASSPFPPVEEVEDLEFEFDQMENRPTDPTSDNVMDDATEPGDSNEQTIQGDDVDTFEDEDVEGRHQDAHNDFDMDEAAQGNQEDDEEILYEEEEDSAVLIHKDQPPEDTDNTHHPQEDNEFLEPDELFDANADEEEQADQTADRQDTTTEHIDEQNPQESTSALPVGQGSQEDNVDFYRDDGDGPTVDPEVTEFEEDVDAQKQDRPSEAVVQLEESFEEILEAEEEPGTVASRAVNPDEATGNPGSLGTDEARKAEDGTELEADDVAQVSHDELRSVKVIYLGEEMSLFPPKEGDSSTYLLADPSLAFEPIDKLLKSSRDLLGESIGHDDELVLDVPTLGLHICEDSKYSSQITLSQVIDVYLSLNHNENREGVGPLYCNLSSRVCLASQYDYLFAAAQGGRPFSEIVAEHVDSPYDEAEDTDDVDTQEEASNEQADDAQETTSALTAGPDAQARTQSTSQEDGQDFVDQSVQSAPTVADDDGHADRGVQDTDPVDMKDKDVADALFPSAEELEPADDQRAVNEESSPFEPALGTEAEKAPSSHTGQDDNGVLEPAIDTEVSEYLKAALEEPLEEEAEALQEKAEDQFLFDEEVAHPPVTEEQESYNADEFLINSDDELDHEPDPEHAEAEAETFDIGGNDDNEESGINGKHGTGDELAASGAAAPEITPTTPSKKMSKRKVAEEDDDFSIDLNTPEPKRRRPS